MILHPIQFLSHLSLLLNLSTSWLSSSRHCFLPHYMIKASNVYIIFCLHHLLFLVCLFPSSPIIGFFFFFLYILNSFLLNGNKFLYLVFFSLTLLGNQSPYSISLSTNGIKFSSMWFKAIYVAWFAKGKCAIHSILVPMFFLIYCHTLFYISN